MAKYPSGFKPFPSVQDIRGDHEAIYERLAPHCREIASHFCSKHMIPEHLDELEAEADNQLWLIIAEYEENITYFLSFLRTTLWRRLIDFVRVHKLRNVDVSKATQYSPLLKNLEGPTDYDIRVEELRSACTDNSDNLLLSMALYGHTRKEIARFLGVSQKEVRLRASRLASAVTFNSTSYDTLTSEPDEEEDFETLVEEKTVRGMIQTGYTDDEILRALDLPKDKKDFVASFR